MVDVAYRLLPYIQPIDANFSLKMNNYFSEFPISCLIKKHILIDIFGTIQVIFPRNDSSIQVETSNLA